MVERVAKAIMDTAGVPITTPLPGGRWIVNVMVEPEVAARAAIEAMREALCSPTDAMADAYQDAEEHNDHPVECYVNERRLRAMIDAALK